MKARNTKKSLISVLVLGLLLMLAMPGTAFGDHRDRGRRDNREWNRHNRKCAKFVNCHDARDGRWDGRGPRRFRGNHGWRDRDRDEWSWRNRIRRNFDRDDRRFIVRRSYWR